jgi:hypothetical protein
MARTGKSEEFIFVKKFDRFFPILHKQGKIKEPNRDAFMQYIGLNKNSWKNFKKTGIKKIYYVVLELLEKAYPKKPL